jgi:DNA-binding transcriptional regulator/RsmH inhibitor MraZ
VDFVGTYDGRLDDKNRVMFPKELRDPLGPKAFATPKGPFQRLCIYPKEVALRESEKAIGRTATEEEEERARSRFFGGGRWIEPDSQGRFLLPQALLDKVGIPAEGARSIVMVGMGSWFNVWEPGRHKAYLESEAA